VPTTLIARNLMQAQMWGLKTFYYSLINKKGAKAEVEPTPDPVINSVKINGYHFEELNDEDCEACKL